MLAKVITWTTTKYPELMKNVTFIVQFSQGKMDFYIYSVIPTVLILCWSTFTVDQSGLMAVDMYNKMWGFYLILFIFYFFLSNWMDPCKVHAIGNDLRFETWSLLVVLVSCRLHKWDRMILYVLVWSFGFWLFWGFFKLSQTLLGRNPVCVISVWSLSLDSKYD